MKRIFAILLLSLFFTACSTVTTATEKPKYIFYFIADGAGPTHIHVADNYFSATGQEALFYPTLPVFGYVTTNPVGRFITDSAAAGTALSTGSKTRSGFLGILPDSTRLTSIAETLRDRGMKIGIVTSVSLGHATPAAFYAHQPGRTLATGIIDDLFASDFNYFGGGAVGENENQWNYFKSKYPSFGYTVTTTAEGFDALKPGTDKVVAISDELADSNSMAYVIDRKGTFNLASFVSKGIELLDGPDGFFMMVEGGKIDWAAHAGDVYTAIMEIKDFDNAIKVAYDFYLAHPAETLIVITSDHETGGFAAGNTRRGYYNNYPLFEKQKASYYVISEKVAAYRDEPAKRKDIMFGFALIEEQLGLKDLNPYELSRLQEAFAVSMAGERHHMSAEERFMKYDAYEPFTITAIKILNERAGVGTSTYFHTSAPVLLFGVGAGSKVFNGRYDNTDIPKRILSVTE